MGTVKWTKEIDHWIKERCPIREHGYAQIQHILDELNATFLTNFSITAFKTNCYSKGLKLEVMKNTNHRRGEKHHRHNPVGSLQVKKGYVQIKIAEPNQWMQYQRYVWEQHHPGESAKGMVVIFMDGNNRNFDPSNLERVSRGELTVMARKGHTAAMSREERGICLLRARVAIAKVNLAGREKAYALSNKANYERKKNDPAEKAKRAAYEKQRLANIMADPVKHEAYLCKQREYRAKNRERLNAQAREYWRQKRNKK
jgi:phage protein